MQYSTSTRLAPIALKTAEQLAFPVLDPLFAKLDCWLNSNKGTKTLIGFSPKAFEQPLSWWNPPCFAGLPAACSWFSGSVIWKDLEELAKR